MIFRDDKISVTVAENSHYALMPIQQRKALKSYFFRIETPHGVVVFTGDTGPSDAVVRLAQGADVLVAEASSRDAKDRDRFINAMAARNHWPLKRVEAFRAHFRSGHLDTEKSESLPRKLMQRRSCFTTMILWTKPPKRPMQVVSKGTLQARSLLPTISTGSTPRRLMHRAIPTARGYE